MKRIWTALTLGSAFFLLTNVLDASAATIRVKCEKRANRSKISVDGNDLAPGMYSARVVSGANQKTSALQAAVGDEAEFDFDSNPKDIAAGATPIAADFIQGGQVVGKILDTNGNTIVSDTVRCRVK